MNRFNHFALKQIFLLLLSNGLLFCAYSQDVLLKKGNDAYAKNELQEALKYFQQAIDQYPDNPSVNHDYGYTVAVLGDLQKGLEYVDKAVKAEPDTIDWYYHRGELKYYLGEVDGAITDFKVYENKSPNPQYSYVLLAQCYYDKSDMEKTGAYLDKAKSSLEELNYNYYYQLARYQNALGEFSKALKSANKAIELNPGWNLPYFEKGFANYNSGNLQPSIDDYTTYLNVAINDDIAYSNRGLAKEKNNDLEGALADYNKAIELYDKDGVTYLNRAQVYKRKNQFQKALADLDKAEDLLPKYERVYEKRAEVYSMMEKWDLAAKEFTKAISFGKENPINYFGRSTCYLKVSEFQKAYDDASKVLKLTPGDKDAYLNAGIALVNLDELNKALSLVNEGIQKNPDDAMLLYLRSRVHKNMGNTDQAAQDEAKAKRMIGK